jgi:acyl carrier protein
MIKLQGLLREELGLTEAQVQPDQRLSDHGIDSLATVELMFSLEKAFDVNLSDQAGTPQTVADLATFLQNALATQVK